MLRLLFTNTYSIVICKATRKPIIFETDLSLSSAIAGSDYLYKSLGKLSKGGLLPSGVGIMIVDACYNNKILEIETGNLSYFNIKVEMQYGSI